MRKPLAASESPPKARVPLYLAALLFCLFLPSIALAAQNPLEAVVGVTAEVPPDARTANTLGTERAGSGVVIGSDGLVLTIGYLIMEASSVELLLPGGRKVPATTVAYDYETGFGLVKALAPLEIAPMELGRSADLAAAEQVLAVGYGEPHQVVPARVVSRRTFAGYWEYLLPDAIFTSPPHPAFGGAALVGPDGRLLGVGSLIVGDALSDQALPGNMFVPIDALQPIFRDLVARGRSNLPSRPWLGVYSEEFRGHVVVTRVAPGGPAAKAGIQGNEVIAEVNGQPVSNLEEFYRGIWALGNAGTEIPLTVVGPGGIRKVTVRSGDRYNWLKLEPTF